MKKKPLGYLGLATSLLNEGVDPQAVIKHRFMLQALAAGTYTDPVDIDYDQTTFSFTLVNGNRKALFKLFKLSSRAEVVLEEFDPKRANEIYYAGSRRKMRPSMVNATEITLWLWPVLDDLTWFERLRIWIEGRWIALRDRCAKMFSRL
jgi:hypothetical protein